jgi:hypothetical protein
MSDLYRPLARALSLPLLALAWSASAMGATVVQVGTLDLVERSELIFHGTAQSHLVTRSGNSDTIVTRVVFRVQDVLKGPPRGETVELDFLGGTIGGTTLSVADLTIPPVGEEGVYFVEQLDHPQVNPLYGWWQGQFLVRHDDRGRLVVHAHDLEPVYDLEPRSALARHDISAGIAEGVVTHPTPASARPLSLEEFKAQVQQMVEARR